MNWRASRISRTSSSCSAALGRSVCRLIRLQPSGPSSPPSYSWEICASVPMRWVCSLKERIEKLTDLTVIYAFIYLFILRVSRLRWLVSLVRLRPGGLDACCRFLQRLCRRSSLTELQLGFFFPTCHWLSAIVRLYEQMINLFCPQETTYDRIYCPLSVEGAIESRYGEKKERFKPEVQKLFCNFLVHTYKPGQLKQP